MSAPAAALRTAILEEILGGLPADECERIYKAVRYRWALWARPLQVPPSTPWDVLGLVAGKGAGKTRPGAEYCRDKALTMPGSRGALVSRTAADVRDTMVTGESGILAVSPPWFRPKFYPSRRVVVWPNGSEAHMYSADEPDLLRGPQHHWAWGDEFAAWKHRAAYTNLQDGLRLGDHPQTLLTTTPRRTPLFLDTFLGQRPESGGDRPVPARSILGRAEWEFTVKVKDHFGREVPLRTVVRRWRTEENALNLAPGFAAKRRAAYGGSSYGRMELDAEIMEIVEGALWSLETIDKYRVSAMPAHERRIVIVDPSHSEDGAHDAAGIIVMGRGVPTEDNKERLPHGYVIDDRTKHTSPNEWGQAAVKAYNDHRCDFILYESNSSPKKPNVVRDVIKSVDPKGLVKWQGVYAAEDKRTRADPVASLYEAGRVHHYEDPENPGRLAQLEHEMVSWDPWDPKAPSPNRVDALVHGGRHLLIKAPGGLVAPESVGERDSPWR